MALLSQPLDVASEIQPTEIPLPPAKPTDLAALKLVLKDLNKAEYYLLAKGMSVEWDRDDRLYLFRLPQSFWEGSTVPRASLGIPLIYEHIESMLPQAMSALFSDNPPFLAEPRPRTGMPAARAAAALIGYQLENMNFKEELRLMIKTAMVYGTGVAKWGWKRYKRTLTTYKRKGAPEVTSTPVGTLSMPTKDSQKWTEQQEEVEVNEPFVENVHIRHVIVDPELRTPDIRRARYVIHRTYMTVQDLEKLRDLPGYTVPSTSKLVELFKPPKETPERSLLEGRSTTSILNTGTSSLDINMEFKAAPRWYQTSEDPTQQPLEVLEYWTKDRCIVVLNRKLVLKNDANPFGKVPFVSFCFTDVLDSFYGIGVCKLLGGEQRLQQGVINTRLDDLALRLSGAFIRKRGSNTPSQQLRMRPGGIIDTDDDKGIQMLEFPPALSDAFTEVEASDARAQRRTGASEIGMQGSLTKGHNLERTATGVNTIANAAGARMQYFIEAVSNLAYVPLLDAFHEMNSKWLTPDTITTVLNDDLAHAYQGDAIEVKNAKLKFTMLASGKIQARQAMSASLPTLYQFLLSQPVIDALQQQGKKVDIGEMVQMLFDVSSWPNRQSVVIDMTQDDQLRAASQNQMMQQMASGAQDNQNKLQQIDAKGTADAAVSGIQAVLKAAADRQTRGELMKGTEPGLTEV